MIGFGWNFMQNDPFMVLRWIMTYLNDLDQSLSVLTLISLNDNFRVLGVLDGTAQNNPFL